jgi:hypothetical protein
VWFVGGLSTAGIRLLPTLGATAWLASGSTAPLALATVAFGLAMLAGTAWSIRRKHDPPRSVGMALRYLGTVIMVGSLVAAILAGPAVVAFERSANQTLSKLIQNEPLYYYLEQ